LRFLFLIFCFRGNDGLEVTRNLKKPKPNGLDSRLRGNDGFQDYGIVGDDGKRWGLCKKCRLKPFRRHLRRLDV
ncbi:TPA: hypothetical protein ACJJKF_001940, partial [Neisseria meningitidis]